MSCIPVLHESPAGFRRTSIQHQSARTRLIAVHSLVRLWRPLEISDQTGHSPTRLSWEFILLCRRWPVLPATYADAGCGKSNEPGDGRKFTGPRRPDAVLRGKVPVRLPVSQRSRSESALRRKHPAHNLEHVLIHLGLGQTEGTADEYGAIGYPVLANVDKTDDSLCRNWPPLRDFPLLRSPIFLTNAGQRMQNECRTDGQRVGDSILHTKCCS
jgi:hypothetical protein